MEMISDPSVTHIELDPLDPNSFYIFKVIARTKAGDGPPITRRGATLLDGGEVTVLVFVITLLFLLKLLQIRSQLSLILCRLFLLPVPPSNITIISSNTSLNLSWVPGERDRNHGFHILYLKKSRKKRVEGRDGGGGVEGKQLVHV